MDSSTLKEILELKYEIWKLQDKLQVNWILIAVLPIISAALSSLFTYRFTVLITRINNDRADQRMQEQIAEERRKKLKEVVANISATVELLNKQAHQIEIHKLYLAHSKRCYESDNSNNLAKEEVVYHRNGEAEYLWEFHKTQAKLQEHVSSYEQLHTAPECFYFTYGTLKNCLLQEFDFSNIPINDVDEQVQKKIKDIEVKHKNESFAFLGTHLMRCIINNTPR